MREVPASGNEADVCGDRGYLAPVTWSTPAEAIALACELVGMAGPGNITANPHLSRDWVRRAVTCGRVVSAVTALIGPDIAVENTFLVIKRPGDQFTVPAHQDGINDRIQLDPARSVAVWLAVSEATAASGCLEIAVGSHRGGYLPYRRAEAAAGDDRRPLTLAKGTSGSFTPVPLATGQACVLDVRLVHRSGPNTGSAPRIGLNIRYVAPGGWTLRAGPGPHLLPVAGDRW